MPHLGLLIAYTNKCSDRAKWASLIGATWAIAAASGPLIGGAIASRTTWRWCFLVNLPVGAICGTILFLYLHLDSPRLSFWDKAPRVDYLGTVLIGGSALMFLLALSWAGAGYGWGDARVVGLLVGAGGALVPFWLYVSSIRREETDGSVERGAKEPVMPMRLFTHRTNVSAYFVGLCHRLVYMGLVYYLPRISSSKPVLTQCTFKR
jgi:MFS family permease